jgi:hypothetical protein
LPPFISEEQICHTEDRADTHWSTVVKRANSFFERYPLLPQDEHGIWRTPDGACVAWFHDPDGNVLSVTQLPG